MNQYYPRYVEDVKPPATLNREEWKPMEVKPRPVRFWTCEKCGNRKEVVLMESWDFTTDRYCPICKERTKHSIKAR